MTAPAWTPGAWVLDSRAFAYVRNSDGRGVANCGGYSTNTDRGEHIQENEANAALIAAAPELYEALEILRNQCVKDGFASRAGNGWPVAMSLARAALAKARGEQ